MGSKKKMANFIALLHAGWVLLTVSSLPLVIIRNAAYKYYALAFAVVNISSWIIWRGCLLQIWENNLRRKYDPQNVYSGDFIVHYVRKKIRIRVPLWLTKFIAYAYMGLIFFFALK